MIHPSYKELMDKMNEENIALDRPLVTSRYSVVLATSKRARQLNKGAEALAKAKCRKALSVAVNEFYQGKVNLITDAKEPEVEEVVEGIVDEAEVIEEAAVVEE